MHGCQLVRVGPSWVREGIPLRLYPTAPVGLYSGARIELGVDNEAACEARWSQGHGSDASLCSLEVGCLGAQSPCPHRPRRSTLAVFGVSVYIPVCPQDTDLGQVWTFLFLHCVEPTGACINVC